MKKEFHLYHHIKQMIKDALECGEDVTVAIDVDYPLESHKEATYHHVDINAIEDIDAFVASRGGFDYMFVSVRIGWTEIEFH